MQARRTGRKHANPRHLTAKWPGGAGRCAVLALLCGLVPGCAIDQAAHNPLAQRFVWYRFLNGDDIRENCYEGSLRRYRLVYNGRYQEQLRRYEVIADGAGGAYLVSRVQGSVKPSFLRDLARSRRSSVSLVDS